MIYLFVAIGLVALLFADIARGLRESRRQDDAVTAISSQVPCYVAYANRALYVFPFIKWEALKTPERIFLNEVIPAEELEQHLITMSDVKELIFASSSEHWENKADDGQSITDAHLSAIENLTDIEALTLEGTTITDHGLQSFHERGNGTLNSLMLRECPRLTSEGLKDLQRFRNLRELSLSGLENMGDEGVPHLMELENIETIRITFCNVSEEVALELKKHYGDQVEVIWYEFPEE